jgi:hypothetical protein
MNEKAGEVVMQSKTGEYPASRGMTTSPLIRPWPKHLVRPRLAAALQTSRTAAVCCGLQISRKTAACCGLQRILPASKERSGRIEMRPDLSISNQNPIKRIH